MNKLLLFLILPFYHISCYSQSSSIATWKNNAKAAYTIVHDDFGSPAADGIWMYADSICRKRDIKFAFGAITQNCEGRTDIDGMGNTPYQKALELISYGHEVINHSHNHNCAGNGGWGCNTGCCWGVIGDANEDIVTNINYSHNSIYNGTNIWPQFFIYPFDISTQDAEQRLYELGYLGSRSGPHEQFGSDGFLPSTGHFFKISPIVFNDTHANMQNQDSILNYSVDYVIENGGYANRELHNVGSDSWGTVTIDEYIKHIDYVKSKVDIGELWVGTVSEVLTYQLQKLAYSPNTVYNQEDNTVEITFSNISPTLDDQLDSTYFKSPVTLNVEMTGYNPCFLTIIQNTDTISDYQVNNDTISFDVYPYKGLISLYISDVTVSSQ